MNGTAIARSGFRTAAAGVLIGWVAIASCTAWAWAAKPDKAKAPALEGGLSWWSILVIVVALVGVCAVAFKSARRTHLD